MAESLVRTRLGMTLVELLVVVSILVLLSATVLPNLAGREGTRAVRAASTNLSAQFAKAQGAAIAARSPRGIWFEHLTNNTSACIDLYSSEVPAPYRGDTFEARFSLSPVLGYPNAARLSEAPPGCASSLFSGAFGDFTLAGNLVQFNDTGPLYDILEYGGNWVTMMRPMASQVPANTLWPAFAPAAHRFAIYRLPTRFGQPLTLAQGMAIDLLWSGVGTQRFAVQDPATGSANLAGDGFSTAGTAVDDWLPAPEYVASSISGSPGRVVAMFDSSGSLSEIIYVASDPKATTSRLVLTGPLFLLVGRVDRCGLPYTPAPTEDNPGANWQYPDSRWIAVDPRTGVVRVAEPLLRSVTSPPTAITTARESQALIRAGMSSAAP
jgi:prepilin-type N-terminal cleavage/methylation domain-containing protein